MDGTTRFGPNIVRFLLTSGARLWYVVTAYVTPNNVAEVNRVEQAMIAASKVLEMILLGGLNARLVDRREKREDDLATALVEWGLVNITYHFMP